MKSSKKSFSSKKDKVKKKNAGKNNESVNEKLNKTNDKSHIVGPNEINLEDKVL